MATIIKDRPKRTKGKQKIEIKKIQARTNLQVTFSKRRDGLFKKASELSLLCGAQVAVFTFSPGKKLFAFGHPNVDSVINQYLNNDSMSSNGILMSQLGDNSVIQQWNKEYEDGLKKIEEMKKSLKMAEEMKNVKESNGNGGFWWDESNVDTMSFDELGDYVKALKELKRNVGIRANELMMNDINQNFVNGNMNSLGVGSS